MHVIEKELTGPISIVISWVAEPDDLIHIDQVGGVSSATRSSAMGYSIKMIEVIVEVAANQKPIIIDVSNNPHYIKIAEDEIKRHFSRFGEDWNKV